MSLQRHFALRFTRRTAKRSRRNSILQPCDNDRANNDRPKNFYIRKFVHGCLPVLCSRLPVLCSRKDAYTPDGKGGGSGIPMFSSEDLYRIEISKNAKSSSATKN